MKRLSTYPWTSWLLNAWVFIPVFLYFRIALRYSVNIPWSDDYDAILGWLIHFKAAPYTEKILLLFDQHNEHRLFASRLIYVLYNYVIGPVNFRVLTFIGNLQLVVVYCISIYFIYKALPKYWTIPAFIWGLCLFDLNSYENGGVAMTSIANNGVIMYFFLSLFFYSLGDKHRYLVLALFCQFLCIYSNGNGMIGALFITGYTFLLKARVRFRFSLITTLIFSPLYFLHYYAPPHERIPGLNWYHPVGFFLHMAGSHFSVEHSLLFAFAVGVALLFTLPFRSLWDRSEPRLLPFWAILGFVVATMAAAGAFRSNVQGVLYYDSKYMVYTNLLATLTFFFVFRQLQTIPLLLWSGTATMIIIMFIAYHGNYESGKGNFSLENYKLTHWNYYYPDSSRARLISEEACKAGVYCRPTK